MREVSSTITVSVARISLMLLLQILNGQRHQIDALKASAKSKDAIIKSMKKNEKSVSKREKQLSTEVRAWKRCYTNVLKELKELREVQNDHRNNNITCITSLTIM